MSTRAKTRYVDCLFSMVLFLTLLGLPIATAPSLAEGLEDSTEETIENEADGTTESSTEPNPSLESALSSQSGSSGGSSALLSKLQVHGFLTQGYATANFITSGLVPTPPSPSGDEEALGIPEDGTFDYRALALQFRYQMTSNDTMIIQLSNQANGLSPVDELTDEIELDWAFYERRLGANSAIKIGRVQIPYGIFNEIRDVGTILPFYRPSFALYREGSFTSETVDGLAFSRTFEGSSSWSLDLDVYLGEWGSFEAAPGQETKGIRAEDAFGVQLWINPPVSGLRFGIAANTKLLVGGQEGIFRRVGEKQRVDDYLFSVDLTLDKFVFNAEFRQFEPTIPAPGGAPVEIDLEIRAYYFQLGWFPTNKFRIYLQREIGAAKRASVLFSNAPSADVRQDNGITFNYYFSPNLVLKGEYHLVDGEQIGLIPVGIIPPGIPIFQQTVVPFADEGDYTIISFSSSF